MIGELILCALVSGAVAYPVAYFACWRPDPKDDAEECEDNLISLPRNYAPGDLDAKYENTETFPVADYAVTGTPRHIPWHIRKREREAATRTKRKQIEEFRGEA
jgi:hypothetical protein